MTDKPMEPPKSVEAITPTGSPSGSQLDQIRLEAFGCQGKSTALHPQLADRLEAASRRTQMDYLNLPENASDKDVCLGEAQKYITNAKMAVANFDKALEKGDTRDLNHAVRDLDGLYDPITSQAARQAADATMQRAGIGHSWGERGHLTLFKDSGANSDIINFNGLDMTAMRLTKDGQGRITSANPEQVDDALKAVLNK
jgi:hypothetical protein